MVAAAGNLRAALESTARALAEAHIDNLLSGEAALAAAVGSLRTIQGATPTERHAVAAELRAALVALEKCRRLGASLDEVARGTVGARSVAYDAAGSATPLSLGHAFRATV
jgi:hypothetical protein